MRGRKWMVLPALMVAYALMVVAQMAREMTLPASAAKKTEIERLFEKNKMKETIVKPPKGILKYPFLVPSGPYYQLFDWDSHFMGVALTYDHEGKPLATTVEDFLRFAGRNAADTDYTPREITPTGFWALPEMCKPFLAQAAYRASLTMPQ